MHYQPIQIYQQRPRRPALAGGITSPAAVADDPTVRHVLDELAGSKEKGQQQEPAWFHPFAARMPVSVADHLIARLTSAGAVTLDPMMGSGTSIIAARRRGRKGIGVDRDPLALIIGRTAVTDFESARLEELRARVLRRAESTAALGRSLTRLRERMADEDQAFLDYWFPLSVQEQLAALAAAIRKEPEGREKDFAWVVFSALIIAKSAGASLALDLSRSRPHKRADKPIVLPLKAWDRRFRTAMGRLPFLDTGQGTQASVFEGDARTLPLERATVDCVLTSPPYLNAIDYLRAHKFSLVWMGHTIKKLRELRGTMVGTERGLWTMDGLPSRLEERLEGIWGEGQHGALRRRYLSDLTKVFGEIDRVLRPGGLALMAVGPRLISSKRSDAVPVIKMLARQAGLQTVACVKRQLSRANRSLPPPCRSSDDDSPLAQRMRREVIVALRKPHDDVRRKLVSPDPRTPALG